MYKCFEDKMKNRLFILMGKLVVALAAVLVISPATQGRQQQLDHSDRDILSDTAKRRELLKGILRLLPEDQTQHGQISYLDKNFKDWLYRTG